MSATAVHNKNHLDTVLKAVIIYDDFDAATRATALLERVALRTEEGMKWDIKPWRIDVLKQPALAALTVAVAANADLVMLALRPMHAVPAELVDWLDNWAKHRRIEDAAVLVLPAGETEAPAAWNQVMALAERHGLIVLDRHNAEDDRNSVLLGRLWQRQPGARGLERAFARRLPQSSRWGINE